MVPLEVMVEKVCTDCAILVQAECPPCAEPVGSSRRYDLPTTTRRALCSVLGLKLLAFKHLLLTLDSQDPAERYSLCPPGIFSEDL